MPPYVNKLKVGARKPHARRAPGPGGGTDFLRARLEHHGKRLERGGYRTPNGVMKEISPDHVDHPKALP